MAPPPTDPALVAEALATFAALEPTMGLGPAREEAARVTGVSVATIRRAQKAAGGVQTATAKPKASPARKSATKAVKPAPAPKAPPPPAPIPLLPDTLDELKAALEQTKGQLFSLAGRQGYAAAGNLYDKLLKTMAAVERERAKPGSELSALLGKGQAAIMKIKQGAMVVRQREGVSGRCARCGAQLSPEAIEARRAEAAPAEPVH